MKSKYFVKFEDILSAVEKTDIFLNDYTAECAQIIKAAYELQDNGNIEYTVFMTRVIKELKSDKLSGKHIHISKSFAQLKQHLRPLKQKF